MLHRFTLLALICSFSLTSAYASLRFASYNIRNFDYDQRSNVRTNKNELLKIIDDLNADLVAVQEINQAHAFERFVDTLYKGTYETVLSECGGAHGQKLGFVYNTSKLKLTNFTEDLRVTNANSPAQGMCNSGSRPLSIATFKIIDRNELLVAITVHLKAGGRDSSVKKRFKQLSILKNVVRNYRKNGISNIVVMGDFNSTEYVHRGRLNQKFQNIIKDMELLDTAKDLKCTSYWWGGHQDAKQYPSVLDHILMSRSLMGKETVKAKAYGHCAKLQCGVTRESSMGVSFDEVSDHCPILTEVK